jgi:hypothetical protein
MNLLALSFVVPFAVVARAHSLHSFVASKDAMSRMQMCCQIVGTTPVLGFGPDFSRTGYWRGGPEPGP